MARKAQSGYHHGDLRHALIIAAETLLVEKGVEGFTLRECARRAGVSPAAPAHHFGNVAGLLTVIATRGFEGLASSMETGASEGGDVPLRRLAAICLAYIRFARTHPAHLRLMLGRFPLDRSDPALEAARARAYGILVDAIAALPEHGGRLDAAARADLAFAWSLVHGFASLVLDGQLEIAEGSDREAALDALSAAIIEKVAKALRSEG